MKAVTRHKGHPILAAGVSDSARAIRKLIENVTIMPTPSRLSLAP
jgi:hypothetical protein